MNDYIAKPVDERILYVKIVGLVKKPIDLNTTESEENAVEESHELKCTDLKYLFTRTKSNSILIMEMISLYLVQTPLLVKEMKKGFLNSDWKLLHSSLHKMIPSFVIMGISQDFENMARKVQEYAIIRQQSDGIYNLVLQLESVCVQACKELNEELMRIKNTQQ
jgi:YesN/AraC family two-component response regulator